MTNDRGDFLKLDTATTDRLDRPPGRLRELLVSDHVVAMTLDGLRLRREREALAYWAGCSIACEQETGSTAIITSVVFPQIESGYDHFRLLEGEMARISEWCATADVWILAQLHTHPSDEPHSEADETWPASHRDGFLSIVIPFFAEFSTVTTPFWRVHTRGPTGWEDVTASAMIRIIPSVLVTSGYAR